MRARARVEPSDEAWDVLDRLAKVYVDAPITSPAPKAPGFVIHYEIERISGVGRWTD